jgi:hypothetical protein
MFPTLVQIDKPSAELRHLISRISDKQDLAKKSPGNMELLERGDGIGYNDYITNRLKLREKILEDTIKKLDQNSKIDTETIKFLNDKDEAEKVYAKLKKSVSTVIGTGCALAPFLLIAKFKKTALAVLAIAGSMAYAHVNSGNQLETSLGSEISRDEFERALGAEGIASDELDTSAFRRQDLATIFDSPFTAAKSADDIYIELKNYDPDQETATDQCFVLDNDLTTNWRTQVDCPPMPIRSQ